LTPRPGVYDQAGFEVRFEWGLAGARVLAAVSQVLVVVDVLSFSTAVEVALARGATVVPAPWDQQRPAAEPGAILAVGRSQTTPAAPYSLSPASLADLPAGACLVLPSPNGATITSAAAELGPVVLTGCLRNARAVAKAADALGGTVGVVAAGERWPDGGLRPALEDLLGAGAILAHLRGRTRSPEAQAAAGIARSLDPAEQLPDCASGRELIAAGYEQDVRIAAELDVSPVVPLLRGGTFTDHRKEPPATNWAVPEGAARQSTVLDDSSEGSR
jgi:2-phosphosulfolactate phosphatase